jgi:tetratricopeptide (TPR) repeat protein
MKSIFEKMILAVVALTVTTAISYAQAPKWLEKNRKAVFSVITYDAEGNILNSGNGFFVGGDGTALADFGLFNGASKAVVVGVDGKRMDVDAILGANDMYDVVKFRVDVTDKKQQYLSVAATQAAEGDKVYLLPYSTQKDRPCATGSVKSIAKIGDSHAYYTLALELADKMVSCPVVNANGEVIGIAQRNTARDSASVCYAAGASYGMALEITPFSMSSPALKAIKMRKALPDNEEQALLTLMMASSQLNEKEYLAMLDDFVKQYPSSVDGYTRRGAAKAYNIDDAESLKAAAADYEKAISVSKRKDDAYFAYAKQIYNYQMNAPKTTYADWTFEKALEYDNKAMAIDSLPAYLQLAGDIEFAQTNYAKSYEWYARVNKSDIVSPASYFSTAKACELMGGDPAEVVALMDSCVNLLPQPVSAGNAPYIFERAQAKMKAKQYRAAVADYNTYYDAMNGRVNDIFYYYREQAALNARQYQTAIDDIAKAIEINPTDQTYRIEQAAVNLRVGRYEEARDMFEKILAEMPDYAEGYRLLGVAQIQLKQTEKACANFQKAKELGDDLAQSLLDRYCK